MPMARDRPAVATADTPKGYKNFGFDYFNGHFFAITQNHERYPRATIEELRQHFDHGTSLDRDAAWYEAQLIHYGIAHSVWKPKARMDLQDKLNLGLLTVPVELENLEDKLRELNRHRITTSSFKANVPTVGGVKRKADERVLTFPFIGPSELGSEPSERSEGSEPKPNSGSGSGFGSEHGATLELALDSESAPNSNAEAETGAENDDQYSVDNDRRLAAPKHDRSASIGLNGRYQVECPYVTEHWPDYRSHLYLVFAIDGHGVWATFNFGQVEGVMHFPVKPRRVSDPPMPCMWRGRGVNGRNVSADHHTGWIKFLQFGELEGEIYDEEAVVKFTAQRRDSPANLTPIPLEAMQDKWEAYAEAAVERERKIPRR